MSELGHSVSFWLVLLLVTFAATEILTLKSRVSVQGVKSLGGHFACLCWGFEFYKEKKMVLFFKKKMEILLQF